MGCGNSRDVTPVTDMESCIVSGSIDQSVVVWPNHICSKCRKSPIIGRLSTCDMCGYMLCSHCALEHTHEHGLTLLQWLPVNTDDHILQRVMQTLVAIPWYFVFVGDRVIATYTTSTIGTQTIVVSVSSNRLQIHACGLCAVKQEKIPRVCQGLTYLNNEVSFGHFCYNPLDSTVSFLLSYIELSTEASPLFWEYLQQTIARLDAEVPRLRRLCLGEEPIEDIYPQDVPLQILVEKDTSFSRFLWDSFDSFAHGDFKADAQQRKNALLEKKLIVSDPVLEGLRKDAGLDAPHALGEIRYVLQLLLRSPNSRNIVIKMRNSNGGILSTSCKYAATWSFFRNCGFRNCGNENLKMDTIDVFGLQSHLRKIEEPYNMDIIPDHCSDCTCRLSGRCSLNSCLTDPDIQEFLLNSELMQSILDANKLEQNHSVIHRALPT